jgi:hypothetical protein
LAGTIQKGGKIAEKAKFEAVKSGFSIFGKFKATTA